MYFIDSILSNLPTPHYFYHLVSIVLRTINHKAKQTNIEDQRAELIGGQNWQLRMDFVGIILRKYIIQSEIWIVGSFDEGATWFSI